jgi:predicted amidohydrolase YtcJ
MSELVLLGARLLDPVTGLQGHTALAAAGGRISCLGDDREVRAHASGAATVIDVKGSVVIPGLTDGHMHPVSGAERTAGIDLSRCADLASVREALAGAVGALAPGVWLRGWGLDPNVFGTGAVTLGSFGPLLDGIPAAIDLFDGHSMLASPRALELAGIDGPRRFGQAAEVVCDDAGRPTGLLLEDAACALVEAVAPRPGRDERRARAAAALASMAAAGLTGGHAMDGEGLELYDALEAEGELPLRIRVAPWCQPDATDVAGLVRAQGTGGRLWRIAGVKLFLDGTIDNGTAWLERPDSHGESDHAFWPDPDSYTEVVAAFHGAGVPTATHAIGDAAVRHVLDSVEKARADSGGDRPVRHRVEHIETIPDDTVRRFASLGVAASMQPTHCCEYTRADHTDNWSRRLGEQRAARGWRCRDLLESGARVILGSDWPIAPFAPLGVMAGARHRRPSRDLSQPPHGLAQALTPLQALQGLTVHPAWAAGEEGSAGRLAVGYRADLTVLADNPLCVPDGDLAGLPVLLTVLGGRVTHRAPGV